MGTSEGRRLAGRVLGAVPSSLLLAAAANAREGSVEEHWLLGAVPSGLLPATTATARVEEHWHWLLGAVLPAATATARVKEHWLLGAVPSSPSP